MSKSCFSIEALQCIAQQWRPYCTEVCSWWRLAALAARWALRRDPLRGSSLIGMLKVEKMFFCSLVTRCCRKGWFWNLTPYETMLQLSK